MTDFGKPVKSTASGQMWDVLIDLTEFMKSLLDERNFWRDAYRKARRMPEELGKAADYLDASLPD